MSYDPTEPTPTDVIRGWAGDTSNDPDAEIMLDATYMAIMSRFGVDVGAVNPTATAPFYRAAAESLRRVAVVLQNKPSSISAPSDGSISWGSRTTALETKAKELDALAAAVDAAAGIPEWFGPVVTVRDRFLTESGGETW